MRAALSAAHRLAPPLSGVRRGRRGPAPVAAGPVHLVRREETDDGGIMFSFGDGPAPTQAPPTPPTPPSPAAVEETAPPSRGAAVAAAHTHAHAHSRADLAAMKVADLKKLAVGAGVKGASKLKKAELVDALLAGSGA